MVFPCQIASIFFKSLDAIKKYQQVMGLNGHNKYVPVLMAQTGTTDMMTSFRQSRILVNTMKQQLINAN